MVRCGVPNKSLYNNRLGETRDVKTERKVLLSFEKESRNTQKNVIHVLYFSGREGMYL